MTIKQNKGMESFILELGTRANKVETLRVKTIALTKIVQCQKGDYQTDELQIR
jgi:hypothetical protein